MLVHWTAMTCTVYNAAENVFMFSSSSIYGKYLSLYHLLIVNNVAYLNVLYVYCNFNKHNIKLTARLLAGILIVP